MYICLECGEVFEHPKEYKEYYVNEVINGTNSYTYYACPRCEGAYEEAVECEECGDFVPKSEINYVLQGEKFIRMCNKCYEEEENNE